MNRFRMSQLVLLLVVSASSAPSVLAAPHSFDIKDGLGEEVKIEQGWFGTKKKVVKDRMGNGFSTKKGLFGSTEQQASVLGNSVKRKKGIFGSTDLEGSTIFGDKVSTKRGLFGQRHTTVDVSGSASVIKTLLGSKLGAKMPNQRSSVDPGNCPPPGAQYQGSPYQQGGFPPSGSFPPPEQGANDGGYNSN